MKRLKKISILFAVIVSLSLISAALASCNDEASTDINYKVDGSVVTRNEFLNRAEALENDDGDSFVVDVYYYFDYESYSESMDVVNLTGKTEESLIETYGSLEDAYYRYRNETYAEAEGLLEGYSMEDKANTIAEKRAEDDGLISAVISNRGNVIVRFYDLQSFVEFDENVIQSENATSSVVKIITQISEMKPASMA